MAVRLDDIDYFLAVAEHGQVRRAAGALGLNFFALLGATFYVVFYLQGVLDYSPLQAGATLLPDGEVKNGNIHFVAPDEPGEKEDERKINLDMLEFDYFAPIVQDKLSEPDQRIELDIRTAVAEPSGD